MVFAGGRAAVVVEPVVLVTSGAGTVSSGSVVVASVVVSTVAVVSVVVAVVVVVDAVRQRLRGVVARRRHARRRGRGTRAHDCTHGRRQQRGRRDGADATPKHGAETIRICVARRVSSENRARVRLGGDDRRDRGERPDEEEVDPERPTAADPEQQASHPVDLVRERVPVRHDAEPARA